MAYFSRRIALMKTIQTIAALALAVLNIFVARGADQSPAVKKDLEQLQGTWVMVSGKADGQPMPEDMAKLMRRTCKGDETTTMMNGQVFLRAKITINPTKTPKTIDYEMLEGVTKGKTQLGIYEIDGDTFKSCFAAPGGERPSEFTNKPGDRHTLSIWKREKKPSPVPEQK